MTPLVENEIEEVKRIRRRRGVERLDLFGSAAADRFDLQGSELDFVVSFERRDPPELFDRYFSLKEDLEKLFGRGVDEPSRGIPTSPSAWQRPASPCCGLSVPRRRSKTIPKIGS